MRFEQAFEAMITAEVRFAIRTLVGLDDQVFIRLGQVQLRHQRAQVVDAKPGRECLAFRGVLGVDLDLHERQPLGDRCIDVAQRQLFQGHFDPSGAGDQHGLGRSARCAGGCDEMLLAGDGFGHVELNAERVFEREVPGQSCVQAFFAKAADQRQLQVQGLVGALERQDVALQQGLEFGPVGWRNLAEPDRQLRGQCAALVLLQKLRVGQFAHGVGRYAEFLDRLHAQGFQFPGLTLGVVRGAPKHLFNLGDPAIELHGEAVVERGLIEQGQFYGRGARRRHAEPPFKRLERVEVLQPALAARPIQQQVLGR